MNRPFLALCLAGLTTTGCRCGPGSTNSLAPEVVTDPKALVFRSCSEKTNAGVKISGVLPDERTVTLTNNGKVPAQLSYTIAGQDAAAFTVAPSAPTSLESGGSAPLAIRFQAQKSTGGHTAELSIDDGNTSTDVVKVLLSGSAIEDLEAVPKLKVEYETLPGSALSACLAGLSCVQNYPDTLFLDSTRLKVRLSNVGCPALNIEGLEVVPFSGKSGTAAFSVESPAVPPSKNSPIVLSAAGTTPSTDIIVRFAPIDDDETSVDRFAWLRLKTNDVTVTDGDGVMGGFDLNIQGSGLRPQLYVVPQECDFNRAGDPCGYPTPTANKGRFGLRNYGNAGIKIDSVTFASSDGGTSVATGRFKLMNNVVGQAITLDGGAVNLDIEHDDKPLYISDTVTVSASFIVGMTAPGTAGRAFIRLYGGKKPCMTVESPSDPSGDRLDFNDPPDLVTTKTVTIKNGPATSCGELILGKVAIQDNPFFSLIAPLVAAGTAVAPGTSVALTVQYKKPVTGGTQTGSLLIESNDSAFPTQGKLVVLASKSPLDEIPNAVLKGCLTSDPTCAAGKSGSFQVNLSQLGVTKEILLYGKDSFDKTSMGSVPATQYLFKLDAKPSNAGGAMLENANMKVTNGVAKLTLDGNATGVYRTTLRVFDSAGQQSAYNELKVIVYP